MRFFMSGGSDGNTAGSLNIYCAVHWNVERQGHLVHVYDVIAGKFVFVDLLPDKSTKQGYLFIMICGKLLS